MKTQSNAIKALTVCVVGSLLTACGSGTSKSSSDSAGSTGNSGTTQQQPEVNLSPVEITSNNYTRITSQSLKSLLLNDAGTTALNRSVTVTSTYPNSLANVATGLVIQMHPYPCAEGGKVSFTAEIRDANGNAQVDFTRPLRADFDTTFANCVQAGNGLHGQVALDVTGNLNDFVNGAQFSLNAEVSTADLVVNQLNMPEFNLAGDFSYTVSSSDGATVVTEVTSSNSIYYADTNYEMVDFHVVKEVDNNTGAYSYHINSEYTDSFNQGEVVHYQTIEELTGTGFGLPTGGVLAINGADSSVMVHVEENEVLRLELDLDNDNTIDETYLTNWHDLVLESFDADVVQF